MEERVFNEGTANSVRKEDGSERIAEQFVVGEGLTGSSR
jgi:hypothetical protein